MSFDTVIPLLAFMVGSLAIVGAFSWFLIWLNRHAEGGVNGHHRAEVAAKRMRVAERELDKLRDHVVDLWHEGKIDETNLHEALGMTYEEYRRWVRKPGVPHAS